MSTEWGRGSSGRLIKLYLLILYLSYLTPRELQARVIDDALGKNTLSKGERSHESAMTPNSKQGGANRAYYLSKHNVGFDYKRPRRLLALALSY